MILDGGQTRIGLESTVIDATGETPVVLRVGAVPREEIERVIGRAIAQADGRDPHMPQSPGMLERHYAPATPIRLNAREVQVRRGAARIRRQAAPRTKVLFTI